MASAAPSAQERRPSAEGRQAVGRAARKRARRSDLARWERTREADPVSTLSAQNTIRLDDLVPLRYRRMATSAVALLPRRCGCDGRRPRVPPDTGLTVQLCGDAHVLNFGLWATPSDNCRSICATSTRPLPGPFEWDVSRLVASIVVLARESGLKASVAEEAVARCLQTYSERIGHYARAKQLDIWYDLITVQTSSSRCLQSDDQEQVSRTSSSKARRRTSAGAAGSSPSASEGQLRIIEDPPLRVRLQADELALEDEVFEAYRASLPEYRRHLLDRFSFVDAARQVVGVGSVGMRVFLVLLEGRDGADPLFLQIKQAGRSVYEAHLRSQPAREPWRAGGRRQTPDPERDRHLRGLHLGRRTTTSTSGSSAT